MGISELPPVALVSYLVGLLGTSTCSQVYVKTSPDADNGGVLLRHPFLLPCTIAVCFLVCLCV